MHLSDEDIAKLGTLGRLALSPTQRHEYAEQLSRIVEYTDRIAEGDVSATDGKLRMALPARELREDSVLKSGDEVAATLAPRREGRFIVSPPIA